MVFIGGVPVALLRAVTLDAAADLEGAWRRQVPAGFTLPEVASGVPLCEELAADKVLFIGFSKISLGGRDLGPTSQLDSDAGAGAVVLALDRAVKADVTKRAANVHALNLVLRRLGLNPREPGESVWLDRLKYPIGRTLVWFKKAFRGYKPRVGF